MKRRRVKKSGIPGGIVSERGMIRVTGTPLVVLRGVEPIADLLLIALVRLGSAVIERSHFTWAIPYHPAITRRNGNPCWGGSGVPFIS